MSEDESIKTQFDELLLLLKSHKGKFVRVSLLSSQTKMSHKDAIKWLSILERGGDVHLENRFDGVYAKWIGQFEESEVFPENILPINHPKTDIELAVEAEKEAHQKILSNKQKALHSSTLDEKLRRFDRLISDLKDKEKISKKEEFDISFGQKDSKTDNDIEVPLPPETKKSNAESSSLTIDEILVPESQKIDKIIKEKFTPQTLKESEKYSDELSQQVKKINDKIQEIEKIRFEKEKILNEYFLPVKQKFEVELETISERILGLEQNVLGYQTRISNLPKKVSTAEELQHASRKAYDEMRKSYDNASVYLEEMGIAMKEEAEKLDIISEQVKDDLQFFKSKSNELENAQKNLLGLQNKTSEMVISARKMLTEHAKQLSLMEKQSEELAEIKDEIDESLTDLASEMESSKENLSLLDGQVSQLKNVGAWASSIKTDYEKNINEVKKYIDNCENEFNSLRSAVEENFARRYLREIRLLADEYSYEFDQGKSLEQNIDERIKKSKSELEALFNESRKIAEKYELQSTDVSHVAKSVKKKAKAFESIEGLTNQADQVEKTIKEILNGQNDSSNLLKRKARKKK